MSIVHALVNRCPPYLMSLSPFFPLTQLSLQLHLLPPLAPTTIHPPTSPPAMDEGHGVSTCTRQTLGGHGNLSNTPASPPPESSEASQCDSSAWCSLYYLHSWWTKVFPAKKNSVIDSRVFWNEDMPWIPPWHTETNTLLFHPPLSSPCTPSISLIFSTCMLFHPCPTRRHIPRVIPHIRPSIFLGLLHDMPCSTTRLAHRFPHDSNGVFLLLYCEETSSRKMKLACGFVYVVYSFHPIMSVI